MLEVFQIVIPEFQGLKPEISEKVMFKPDGEELRVKTRFFKITGVDFWESEIPGVFNSEFMVPEEAHFLAEKLAKSGIEFNHIY